MQIKYLKGLCLVMASAFMLNGCSGSDGGGTTFDTPTGTPVKVTDLTADQWAALSPKAEVSSVTINSPPVVKFKVTDANGNPLVGLENNTTQNSTATLAGNSNVSFSLAKLVPGSNGAPSKWVNYIVTTVPTYKSATDKTVVASTGSRPTTDNTGTLVGNGDGTYQYTFYRDITNIKAQVAAMTLTSPNVAGDLGDLTYDPTLTHRLTIQVSGNARNTGTNTADGSTSTSYPTAVRMSNPLNFIYDFRPDGGAVTAKRDITLIAKCNECHAKLAFHGGGRVEAQYCVVCHTDQRKFGRAEATAGTTTTYTGSTYRVNNIAAGDFPNMVHQIHMGKKLTKTGYDYAGVKYNGIVYPQTVLNCTKCHENSTAAPQGNNWKTEVSRLACGSCHDGINFATGVGHAVQTSDANCKVCHNSAAPTLDPFAAHKAKMPSNSDATLRTMSAKILGVTVNTNGNVTANFTVSDNGVAVTDVTKFAAPTFMLVKLVKNAEGTLNWVGYTNQYNTKSSTMAPVLQTKGEKNGTLVANTDGTFSYTFKLITAESEGDIRTVTHAHNISGNTDVTKDTAGTYSSYNGDLVNWGPLVKLPAIVAYEPTKTHRVAMTSSKVAVAPGNTGFNAWYDFVPAGGAVTETRDIVKMANCASCHANQKLHAAYDIEVCVTCHNPSKDPYTGESVSLEYMIHKIHMGKDLPSVIAGGTYKVNGPGHDYSGAAFPGIIKNCQSCHVETGNTNGANWRTTATAGACATCHDGTATISHVTTSQMVNNCNTCHGTGAARSSQVVHQ